MDKQDSLFMLYRLNVNQSDPSLFDNDQPGLRGRDDLIKEVLKHSTEAKFATYSQGSKNSFQWMLREFTEQTAAGKQVFVMTLARSVTAQSGRVVTETDIVEGVSVGMPPLAETVSLIFYVSRHLVAVEVNSSMTKTNRWRESFSKLVLNSAMDLGYRGALELEPIPRKEEMLEAFLSFDRLVRLSLTIRLPNPELSRHAAALYDEMKSSGIEQLKQDMRSGSGVSRAEGRLPRAAVELASNGYKKGDVVFVGDRNGRHETVRSGRKAAAFSARHLRDYVRGLKDQAKTKDAGQALGHVLNEIDRLHPSPNRDAGADG